MLLGEKLVVVVVAAVFSPLSTPFLLYNDLNELDILLRGDGDTVDHNYGRTKRTTLTEYMFP